MQAEERILPFSVTVELVNDERIPAELRVQLVETESYSYYPTLFKSFACLQRLYPKLNEETVLGLITYLWPGESARPTRTIGTKLTISEAEQRQFMELVARDPREAVTRRVNKVKNLPMDLCLPLAKGWLSHPMESVRENTVAKLGSYATRDVVPLILPLLNDKDSGVRAKAASVLGSLAAVEAEEALRKLRADPSTTVRKAVGTALQSITEVKNLNSPPVETPPKR
jgi:HEAT repeat protein